MDVEKITFLGTGRPVSLKPGFLTRWFFRQSPNHLKIFTRDILSNHRENVKVLQFFEFSTIYSASETEVKTLELTLKG